MDETKTHYDLAIIGGGIAGVGVARDAALRGLTTVLFEKNRLGSGASSKSSKLIHGGIRYLELAWTDFKHLRWVKASKNFRFVLSSLRESRTLSRIGAQHIVPLRLLVPIYKNSSRSSFSVYMGTLLYGALSVLTGHQQTPRLFIGQKQALSALPQLNPQGLAGAVEIGDHTTNDLSLVHAVADSARRHGAAIREQTAVQGWKWLPDRNLYQIRVELPSTPSDTPHRPPGDFYTRQIINTTGAWIDHLRGVPETLPERFVLGVGGSHIELAAFLNRSVILEAKDGRVFFVIERNGRARVGTTEWPCRHPEEARVPEKDIDYLLESLGRYFPGRTFTRADVLSSDAGVRPLAIDGHAGNVNQISREHRVRIDHDGTLHLVGVKLTDHRRAAQDAVDQIFKNLHIKDPGCTTSIVPL